MGCGRRGGDTHQDDGNFDVVVVEFLHQVGKVSPVDGIVREVPLAVHVVDVECLDVLVTHTRYFMVHACAIMYAQHRGCMD